MAQMICITCELRIPWNPRVLRIFLEYSHGFSTRDSGGGKDDRSDDLQQANQ